MTYMPILTLYFPHYSLIILSLIFPCVPRTVCQLPPVAQSPCASPAASFTSSSSSTSANSIKEVSYICGCSLSLSLSARLGAACLSMAAILLVIVFLVQWFWLLVILPVLLLLPETLGLQHWAHADIIFISMQTFYISKRRICSCWPTSWICS